MLRQETTGYASRIGAVLCAAFLALCAFFAFAQPAFADQTKGADRVADPSTAEGNGAILGEGTTNTLNSGRVWADKSVYTEDATVDGVTVTNDADFLVVFSALGSSTARKGTSNDGAPPSPIAGKDDSLSYSDPLGEYMEPVGDVTLVQFGQSYTYASSKSSSTSISYKPTVDQSIVNQSYGDVNRSFKLSDIVIEARKDNAANRWVMNVNIPSNALPLYLSILNYGAPDATGNQSVKGFTTNAGQVSSLPLRIAYSVGISQSVKAADGTVDLTKISDAYQQSHIVQTSSGTGVSFCSNQYDDPTAAISPDDTYGNATVRLTPAPDNGFYFFQENLTVYRNGNVGTYNGDPVIFGNVSNPVMNLYEIQSNPQRLFYVARSYYRRSGTGGVHNAYEVLSYTGSELANAVCYYDPALERPVSAPSTSTVVTTKVGSPCIGNVAKFRTKKASNPTGTAAYSYYGSFVIDPSIVGACDAEAHYGNNGVLTVSYLPSDALQVSGEKRFQVNGSIWAPTAVDYGTFRFSVIPNRSNPQDDPVALGGIVASSDEHGFIRFNIGSYVRPGVYLYDVRELFPDETIPGLSYDSTSYTLRVEARAGANGKIELATSVLQDGVVLPAGQTIAFTNVYDTASVRVPLIGRVELEGTTLERGMFSFALETVSAIGASGAIASPLPSITNALNAQSGAFSFGDIVFTQAGRYVYRVLQNMLGLDVPADDYALDATRYLVTYVVSHSSTGPLYVTTSIQKEGQPDAADGIVFLNQAKTPQLVIEKTQSIPGIEDAESIDVVADDVITYRITLSNPSSVAVHDVLVYDAIPDGLILEGDFGSHAAGPYLYNGRLYWIVKQLAGGESVSFEFTAKVPEADPSTIWANLASASYPDLIDENDVVTVDSPSVFAYFASPRDPEPTPGVTPKPPVPGDEPGNSTSSTPIVSPGTSAPVGNGTAAATASSTFDNGVMSVTAYQGYVRTGDRSMLSLFLLIGVIAAIALVACAVMRRRETH